MSVAIPAYNAAASIAETLTSLVAQDYPSFEIIVVDDGSSDDTAAIAEGFGPLVRVLRQKNAGLAAARNAGVRAARGDLVALMDADDLAAPERLSMQVRVFLQRPDVCLCATEFSAFDAKGAFTPTYASRYYSALRAAAGGARSLLRASDDLVVSEHAPVALTYVGDAYESLVKGNFLHPPTVMFRREVFDEAGAFDGSFRYASDWEWLVRAARCGRVAYVDHPLLAYRISPTQMSTAKNISATTVEFSSVLEKICRADPGLLGRPEIKRQMQTFFVEAADTLADDDPLKTLQLLLRSVHFGPPTNDAVRVATKALMPSFVMHRIRHARGHARRHA